MTGILLKSAEDNSVNAFSKKHHVVHGALPHFFSLLSQDQKECIEVFVPTE